MSNINEESIEKVSKVSAKGKKGVKVEPKVETKFDDNKQYYCYTKFGSIKAYGKQLNIARPEYMSQFIRFEEINK